MEVKIRNKDYIKLVALDKDDLSSTKKEYISLGKKSKEKWEVQEKQWKIWSKKEHRHQMELKEIALKEKYIKARSATKG